MWQKEWLILLIHLIYLRSWPVKAILFCKIYRAQKGITSRMSFGTDWREMKDATNWTEVDCQVKEVLIHVGYANCWHARRKNPKDHGFDGSCMAIRYVSLDVDGAKTCISCLNSMICNEYCKYVMWVFDRNNCTRPCYLQNLKVLNTYSMLGAHPTRCFKTLAVSSASSLSPFLCFLHSHVW
jgi:hypothetical protein